MQTITKSAMVALMQDYLDNGLTNEEIAERLNEKFEADESNRINKSHVAKIKERVGLKGAKPKRKVLFEMVDDTDLPQTTPTQPHVNPVVAEETKELEAVTENETDDHPFDY